MSKPAQQLESLVPGGYTPYGAAMAEPTAWAALALSLAGNEQAASLATTWLADQQSSTGVVPCTGNGDSPGWTTSLAMLAWNEIDSSRFQRETKLGADWLLRTEGTKNPRSEHIGHDTQLVGWSWAENTHSWLEPTAFATMALSATGYQHHARTTEAIRLLLNRLLEDGGANYGNTVVLGNKLLPHLQPSSIVLWALALQDIDDPRIERTIDYIEQQLTRPTGCASLAYALLALTAYGRRPHNAEALINGALARPTTKNSCYKLALLSLASQREPLFAELPTQ